MVRQFLFLLLGLGQFPLQAGVVGDFSGVRNLPGHIGLHKRDKVYKSPVESPHKRDDDTEQRTASQILREDYLRRDGTIDVNAITAKILAIKNHENVAYMAYCVEKLPDKANGHVHYCKSRVDEKISKKWNKKKITVYYRFAISELQKARVLADGVTKDNINTPASQDFLEHLFQGLETFESIKDQDPPNTDIINAMRSVKFLDKLRIRNGVEAANLVIPAAMKEKYPELRNRIFFSPELLRKYERKGDINIASLDPLDSGFWRKPRSIREFDTRNYDGLAGVGSDISDPDREISVTYDWSGGFSGRTPKMRVTYGGKEWKVKYLSESKDIFQALRLSIIAMRWRKYAHEVNTETAVNNLAAALGFTVDPTFFKKRIKLYLPQKNPTDAAEFERLHRRVLDAQRRWRGYDPLKAFSDVQIDDHGRYYIQMRAVSLEKRSRRDSDLAVGGFIKTTFGRVFKREFRAFAMFYVWVADHDTKDSNADIVLTADGDSYKVAYSARDMGHVFGSYLAKDAPNFLSRSLIDKITRAPNQKIREVTLGYRIFFNNAIFDAVNINDARWMTRLIVQLSPTQIKNAFLTAGYNDMVSEYYTQLMLLRRDQLAEAFGLLGQTITDAAGNRIFIKKESKIVDSDTYAVEGYEDYFRDGYLFDPEGKVTENPHDFIRRYYGRTFKNVSPGTAQNAAWTAVKAKLKTTTLTQLTSRLSKLKVTNRTFGLPLLDGGFCKEECFYDGLRIGLNNFVPSRFLLENPYYRKGENKPLLVVDVYRFGFFLGADIGEDFTSRFGFKHKLNTDFPAAGYEHVFEFIRVKPVDSIVEGGKNLRDLSPLRVLRYKKISEQLLEGMEEDEVLISSSYLSKRIGIEMGQYPLLTRPLVSSGFDLQRVTVGRSAVMMGKDNKMMVQFSDLAATKLWLGVKGELLLADFPILSYELEKLQKSDLLFEFDLDSEEQSELVRKNIALTSPSEDMQEFKVVKREITNKKRKIGMMLSFAKSLFDNIDITTVEIREGEREDELHVSTTEEEVRPKLGLLSSRHTLLESYVTKNDEVFVKLNMHYSHMLGLREHFAWVYDNMLPLLGRPFILFRPQDIGYYLDDFKFSGEVYILPAGIEKILGLDTGVRSLSKLCTIYARYVPRPTAALVWEGRGYAPQEWCRRVLSADESRFSGEYGRWVGRQERDFKNFRAKFVKARNSYRQKLEGDLDREERHKILRNKAEHVAKLFEANGFKPAVWQALQAIAGEENIYRNGVLTSRTGGFPGQTKVIEMPESTRGGAGDRVITTFNNIIQSVQIYTDPLFGELQGIFYESMGEELVPRLAE